MLADGFRTRIKREEDHVHARQADLRAKKSSSETGDASAAQAKVYDVDIKVTGLAPTDTQVGELIKKLKAIPIFEDVNLVVSDWEKTDNRSKDKNTNAQYRKFQIEMTLDRNADVHDMTEPLSTASTGSNK